MIKRFLPEQATKKYSRLLRCAVCAVMVLALLTAGVRSSADEPVDIPIDQRIAEAKAEIGNMHVGKYGMTPVYPRDIADGRYHVKADSSSPDFRILDVLLNVDGQKMSASITVYGTGYQYVYPGTAQDAEKVPEENRMGAVQSEGNSVFTVPIAALNSETDCAAFSGERVGWDNIKLVFYASSLPEDALEIFLPDYEAIEAAIVAYGSGKTYDGTGGSNGQKMSGEAVELDMEDGEYSIEVNMTGGSGRASISSPTLLTVRDGRAYARLIWSSTFYDYMIAGGEVFYDLAEGGGNSVFEIPVTAMDEPVPVIADTTAMGEPVEIEYTLMFYRESIGTKDQIPQEAAKKVLFIGAAILISGGVLNYFIKKKRK